MFPVKMYKPIQNILDKGAALAKAAYERFAPYSDRNTTSVLMLGGIDDCNQCKETVIIRNPKLSAAAFLAAFEEYKRNAEPVTSENFRRLFAPAPEQLELDLEQRV